MHKEVLTREERERAIALYNKFVDLWNEREKKVISRECRLEVHNNPYPIALVANPGGAATLLFEETETGRVYQLTFYGPYYDGWQHPTYLRDHVDREKLRRVVRLH